MKKIDILNFITDFRRSPNNVKSYEELVNHLKPQNEMQLQAMLSELMQTKVIKETDENGQKFYRVVTK